MAASTLGRCSAERSRTMRPGVISAKGIDVSARKRATATYSSQIGRNSAPSTATICGERGGDARSTCAAGV